ncbi:hypothetical protein LC724_36540 [Blautia sp. RD014234]|nr:hypothetical protein [Blautia parvula]
MLLEVKDLETEFKVKRGTVKAVNGVSFEVDKGEILAVVGESGSGKVLPPSPLWARSVIRAVWQGRDPV